MYQCGYSTKHLAIKYKMYVGYKGKTNGKELSAKWVCLGIMGNLN